MPTARLHMGRLQSEGYVFTRVCHSVNSEVAVCIWGRGYAL